MDVTYRIDKDILYIAVEGRVDASNAAAAEAKIFAIKEQNPGKHVVLDADQLEYISSAGLRVILRLRKEAPKLATIPLLILAVGVVLSGVLAQPLMQAIATAAAAIL